MKTKGDVRGITQFPVHSEQGISTIHVGDFHDSHLLCATPEDDTDLPSMGRVLPRCVSSSDGSDGDSQRLIPTFLTKSVALCTSTRELMATVKGSQSDPTQNRTPTCQMAICSF